MNIQANSDPRQAPQEEKKLGRASQDPCANDRTRVPPGPAPQSVERGAEGTERAVDLLCSRGANMRGPREG